VDENTNLLSTLLALVDEGVLIASSDGVVVHCNDAFEQLWRIARPAGDATLESVADAIAQRLVDPRQQQDVRDVLLSRSAGRSECRIEFPDGRAVQLLSQPAPAHQQAGGQLRVCMTRDVSDPDRVARAVRSIATHAQCILYEAIVEGLEGWEQDADGKKRRFRWHITVQDEEAAQRVLPLDVPPGQPYWTAWRDHRVEEDLESMAAVAARALVHGDLNYRQTFRSRDRYHKVHWLHEVVSIEPIERGRWRCFGICTDVTDVKRSEIALRQSEQRFALFMDNLPGPAFMKDHVGRLVYLNAAARRNLPREQRHAWRGRGASDLFPPDVAEVLIQHDRQVLRTMTPIQVMEIVPLKDGPHDYLTNKFAYQGEDKQVWIGGIAIDVTEQRRAEAAVQRQKRLLETLMNAAPAGALFMSPDGRWLLHNQQFIDIWPAPKELILRADASEARRTLATLVKDSDRLYERLRTQASDPHLCVSETIEMLDERILVRTSVPVHADDGSHLGRVVFLQDVTQQERDRRRLRLLARELTRAAERERRRISTLLHDDVGQMLTVALMRLEGIRQDVPEQFRANLAQVGDVLEQVVETARSLSVQLSPPVLHEFGLTRALEWLAQNLLHPQKIQLKCDLNLKAEMKDDKALTLFHATREALVNILKHSRASSVILRAWEADGGAGGDAVHVSVEDDGVGFDAGRWAREPSAGNHFGLFNVREQLEDLGGGLQLESVVNRFTRVHAWVPRGGGDGTPHPLSISNRAGNHDDENANPGG
jgi:signal transduction histidine kinase